MAGASPLRGTGSLLPLPGVPEPGIWPEEPWTLALGLKPNPEEVDDEDDAVIVEGDAGEDGDVEGDADPDNGEDTGAEA